MRCRACKHGVDMFITSLRKALAHYIAKLSSNLPERITPTHVCRRERGL